MGILNVTPDSFSDGGQYLHAQHAVEHGLDMARQGAAIIDIGGESTRPGSERVSPAEQINRLIKPIQHLREALDREGFESVRMSVDTTHADVANAALDIGAAWINDVSAGREDEGMLALAAKRGVPIVLMHMLGQPGTMQQDPCYGDVTQEVFGFLLQRAAVAEEAGVRREQIWLDPGIGFGKTLAHNLELLRSLDRLVAKGYPVLLGVSRKRFIAGCCPDQPGIDQPANRLPGTLAAGLVGIAAGVQALRVHDVAAHRQALAVFTGAQLNTSRTKSE